MNKIIQSFPNARFASKCKFKGFTVIILAFSKTLVYTSLEKLVNFLPKYVHKIVPQITLDFQVKAKRFTVIIIALSKLFS